MDTSERVFFAVVLGVVCALVVVCVVLIRADNREHAAWVAWCTSQGGHVLEDTDTHVGTGVSGSGKPVVVTTTSTDYTCLTADGRVLGVR